MMDEVLLSVIQSNVLFSRLLLLWQIGTRVGVSSQDVHKVIIWGNHSSTQFPDVAHATVTVGGKAVSVPEAVKDDDWLKTDFIKVFFVQIHVSLFHHISKLRSK